jgi:hypothetical protein
MFPIQGETRVPIVIENQLLLPPSIHGVASQAIVSFRVGMDVLVAVGALLKSQTHVSEVSSGLAGEGEKVALLALDVVVGALEGKTGDVVVEKVWFQVPNIGCFTAVFGMAGPAFTFDNPVESRLGDDALAHLGVTPQTLRGGR